MHWVTSSSSCSVTLKLDGRALACGFGRWEECVLKCSVQDCHRAAGLLLPQLVATFFFLCLNLPLPTPQCLYLNITKLSWTELALCGVWEGDFTAENLPVERREGVGRLGVNQTEKLQLVDVEVADGLHRRELWHHLKKGERTEEWGESGEWTQLNRISCTAMQRVASVPLPVSLLTLPLSVGIAAEPRRPSPAASGPSARLSATVGLREITMTRCCY